MHSNYHTNHYSNIYHKGTQNNKKDNINYQEMKLGQKIMTELLKNRLRKWICRLRKRSSSIL